MSPGAAIGALPANTAAAKSCKNCSSYVLEYCYFAKADAENLPEIAAKARRKAGSFYRQQACTDTAP